jgi:hypothetical protein
MDETNQKERLLALLLKFWDKNPELRFFQLLAFLETRFSIGKDSFYVEDKEVIDWLQTKCKTSTMQEENATVLVNQIYP